MIPRPLRSSRAGPLLVLLLSLGLVLMHHTVGAPRDDGDRPAGAVAVPAPAAGEHSAGEHSAGEQSAGEHSAGGHDAGDPAEAPHGDHGSMLLHLCLAVLVALGTAVLIMVGYHRGRPHDDAEADPVGTPVVIPVPRPPPVPVRLARLQVLRL